MLFESREHGLKMGQRRVPQGGKIDVHKYKGCKKEKEQDMDRGNNLYTADKFYIIFKPLDPPEKKPGDHLCRQKDKHDSQVGIFLQDIEFIFRRHVMRIGFPLENA